MRTPARVQGSLDTHRKGRKFRMPENTLWVGKKSAWGSPYQVKSYFPTDINRPVVREDLRFRVIDAAGRTVKTGIGRAREALWLVSDLWVADLRELARDPRFVAQARTELAGKDLMCPCAPERECPTDVLLAIANGGA
ncbi:DUF4326 domain-containing protein [Nocardiopsis sp. NPDC006198]|uniref:DUF4326 domain-containing protein n=1 Tax=Nocardiopsis sp. NPDC006198 TaxID=3154472 RepID=UPI0033B04985